MQTRIDFGSAFALATISLDQGEAVKTEAGAMVGMSPNMQIETSGGGGGGFGGVMKGLKRAALGGESFFMNTYTAANGPGQLSVGPALPGDIVHRVLDAQPVYLTSGNYLASSANVDIDTEWGGAKSFFGGQGLFLLRITGPGEVLASSYGAIHQIDLAAGQTYVVDTGHLVGFTEGTGYNVRKFGGWKSTILGGEGLVVDLTGPGTVWMQTRSPRALLDWIIPQIPKDSN